jgi:hypothetical protein
MRSISADAHCTNSGPAVVDRIGPCRPIAGIPHRHAQAEHAHGQVRMPALRLSRSRHPEMADAGWPTHLPDYRIAMVAEEVRR